MRYNFLVEIFKRELERDSDDNEKDLSGFKENYQYFMIIFACFILLLLYIVQITLLSVLLNDYTFYYLNMMGLSVASIITILFLFFKSCKKVQIILKYTIFLFYYSIQIYWTLFNTFEKIDPIIQLRSIYLLFIFTGFLLVIFLKFNYYFILTICAGNSIVAVILEMFTPHSPISINFVYEIFISMIIPIACLITRVNHENMIKSISTNSRLNTKFIAYTNMLIDQLSCSFISYSKGQVVFSNNTFLEFIKTKFSIYYQSVNEAINANIRREDPNLNDNIYPETLLINDPNNIILPPLEKDFLSSKNYAI